MTPHITTESKHHNSSCRNLEIFYYQPYNWGSLHTLRLQPTVRTVRSGPHTHQLTVAAWPGQRTWRGSILWRTIFLPLRQDSSRVNCFHLWLHQGVDWRIGGRHPFWVSLCIQFIKIVVTNTDPFISSLLWFWFFFFWQLFCLFRALLGHHFILKFCM